MESLGETDGRPWRLRAGMNGLSQATVEELRRILIEDYGREVTEQQAAEIAHTLVGYFDLLTDIYHREQSPDAGEQNL